MPSVTFTDNQTCSIRLSSAISKQASPGISWTIYAELSTNVPFLAVDGTSYPDGTFISHRIDEIRLFSSDFINSHASSHLDHMAPVIKALDTIIEAITFDMYGYLEANDVKVKKEDGASAAAASAAEYVLKLLGTLEYPVQTHRSPLSYRPCYPHPDVFNNLLSYMFDTTGTYAEENMFQCAPPDFPFVTFSERSEPRLSYNDGTTVDVSVDTIAGIPAFAGRKLFSISLPAHLATVLDSKPSKSAYIRELIERDTEDPHKNIPGKNGKELMSSRFILGSIVPECSTGWDLANIESASKVKFPGTEHDTLDIYVAGTEERPAFNASPVGPVAAIPQLLRENGSPVWPTWAYLCDLESTGITPFSSRDSATCIVTTFRLKVHTKLLLHSMDDLLKLDELSKTAKESLQPIIEPENFWSGVSSKYYSYAHNKPRGQDR